MIQTEHEYRATLQRIEKFQRQVVQLRKTELNPNSYRLSARGYLAELDLMQLDVREYLWAVPADQTGFAANT